MSKTQEKMIEVLISDSTKQLIDAHAIGGWTKGAVRAHSGENWWIEVDEEVYAAMMEIDKDPDEAIRKACTLFLLRGGSNAPQ